MLDYIASSVEKTDILAVGVPIAPHSVRHHQMASLPGWMIRIFQPDKDAINPECSILMPPRVAKILKQDKHASTKQRMPKDIWEDQNFMGGLISSLYSEVKACLWGLGGWYKTPKPERSNQALFKSLYQDMKDAPTKLRKEWIVKENGDRLSFREVFCVSLQELRSIHCKKE